MDGLKKIVKKMKNKKTCRGFKKKWKIKKTCRSLKKSEKAVEVSNFFWASESHFKKIGKKNFVIFDWSNLFNLTIGNGQLDRQESECAKKLKSDVFNFFFIF